jgi:hypothetical protein
MLLQCHQKGWPLYASIRRLSAQKKQNNAKNLLKNPKNLWISLWISAVDNLAFSVDNSVDNFLGKKLSTFCPQGYPQVICIDFNKKQTYPQKNGSLTINSLFINLYIYNKIYSRVQQKSVDNSKKFGLAKKNIEENDLRFDRKMKIHKMAAFLRKAILAK